MNHASDFGFSAQGQLPGPSLEQRPFVTSEHAMDIVYRLALAAATTPEEKEAVRVFHDQVVNAADASQQFCFRNDAGEYWSNDQGWVDFDSATFFNRGETISAPVGGTRIDLQAD